MNLRKVVTGKAAALAVCLCMMTGLALAQSTTSLRGTIADEQGAVIPGASVELENSEIGFLRSTSSDASGVYQFLQVPPSRYKLTVMTDGFAVATHTGVELQVGTPATLNVALTVADLVETVNVAAQIALINSVDAAIGNAFNETQVRQLPLLTRNVVELLSLQPGVSPTGETLGARRDQNNIQLDGVDVNDNQTSGLEVSGANPPMAGFNANASGQFRPSGFNAALPVPLDSVQEFRVTVGGQGAAQGRSSGGQVMLVTKSGTNQMHGSAYEFHRNTVTSANNWFNNRAGVGREQLIRNQFGASVGGPIVKNRAFYFFNYEQRIDASAASQIRRVPSESLKAGVIGLRTASGQDITLSPAEVRAIDPQGLGASPAMLSLLNSIPAGNDPASGVDGGVNFSGLRFNAPLRLDNKAYVGKMDFNLDKTGMHKLAVRGTLADNGADEVLAQYPGDRPTSQLINNSRGISGVYTGVLTPTLVNTTTVGLTRIGLERTGTMGPAFTLDSIDQPIDYTRGFTRIAPTWNFANDLAWSKGTHNVTMGANIRLVRNNRVNFANAFPSYSFSRGTLQGLGSDIVELTENYLRGTTGDPNLRIATGPVLSRAFGNTLGVITRGAMNYSYDRDGNPLPIGTPPVRNFASNEFELYLADSWRVKPSLTLTFGLRYSYYGVPYERNGMQVAPTVPLQNFFAERIGGMEAGIPTNQLPNASLYYDFIGPKNGLPSWWSPDKNNFAPRFAFAYAPQSKGGVLGKLIGKNGVLRGGASLVYDRFGSDLVTQFDQAAAFGLNELQMLGPSVNFTTSERFNGVLPAIPNPDPHVFPFRPPDVDFIGGTYMGISTDLKTPYSIIMNFSSARELPGGVTMEVGYAGRLGRGLLMQIDAAGWALNFRDPDSGITWKQMAQEMRGHQDAGIDARAVRTNPGLIPTNPFAEKYFANLTNLYFPGSASANYYDLLWGRFGGSDADAVHAVDRLRSPQFPNCIVVTGCYTFYPPQSSSNSMWSNVGFSTFNAGTLTLRKPFSNGLSFDFNYTLSHAIDNGGAAEAGRGAHSAIVLNPFDYGAFRGSADFDIRHNINANSMYELPFGRNKRFLADAPGWVDHVAGGWQISTIMRYGSALPTAIAYTGLWPTNFSHTTVAYPVDPNYETRVQLNDRGNPSIFSTTEQAASNWRPMLPGEVGSRAAVRLDDVLNFDIALAKAIRMPWEGHRIQFRAEAFNAFNNVNFFNPSLDGNTPSNFGEFRQVQPPRVMQFALRYEF